MNSKKQNNKTFIYLLKQKMNKSQYHHQNPSIIHPQSILTKPSQLSTLHQNNKLIKQTKLIANKETQLRKKLSKINSIDELIKIHTMKHNQNKQLLKDITILKQHLAKVSQNKKQSYHQSSKHINNNISSNNKISKNNNTATQSRIISSITNNNITQQQLKKYPQQLITEWQQLKKQLSQQYKLMTLLKSNIQTIQKQSLTQQQSDRLLTQKNKLKQLTLNIQQQNKKKSLLIKQCQHLQQTVTKQLNLPDNHNNQQQIAQLQQQNKQLRKQILLFKQQTYKHQSIAAKVIDSIYHKKQLLKQIHNDNYIGVVENNSENSNKKRSSSVVNLRNIGEKKSNVINSNSKIKNNNTLSAITSLSNYTSTNIQINNQLHHKQHSTLHTSNNNTLINDKNISTPIPTSPTQQLTQQQITTLKTQINQLSLQSIKAKQQLKKQKQSLKLNNTQLNQNLHILQKSKTKKISQLNHLKSKLKHIINQIQTKQSLKVKMVNYSIQQNYQINHSLYKHNVQLLRRDFVGIIGGKNRFDDRLFLKQNKKSFIKGLIIYQNDNNLTVKGSIAAIRAIYTDQQTNHMNFVPIPGGYLQKCKVQHLQLPQDDFLKLIKVKYNTKQTRLTKIQIRSNRNLKYQFGQKKPFQQLNQNQIVYAFDIGLDQFPVSIFGSYSIVKNCWYLQSLGVEINTLV